MSPAYDSLFLAVVASATDPDRTIRDRYRPFAISFDVVPAPRRPSLVARIAQGGLGSVVGMIAAFPLGLSAATRRRSIAAARRCEPACC
jgi:hypothetical protein